MSEPTTIQDDILQALYEHGPLTRIEIMDRCFLGTDATRCGNALSRLKEKRLIERGDNKTWRLAGCKTLDEHAPAPPSPHDDITPTAKPFANIITSAMGASVAMTALQRAAQHAQDAIDAYVWEVGDPAVLEPLMTSRDAARQALAAYESRA